MKRSLVAYSSNTKIAEFRPSLPNRGVKKRKSYENSSRTSMRSPIGPIRTNPRTRRFLLDTMREVVAVGRAHGVALSAEYAEDRLAFCGGLPAEMVSSMFHDLEKGNRLEVDWLSGGVVELGQAVGVPTPLNRAVSDILALYANGKPKD
jgi:2-dehydropantoate 2-reductase